MTAHSRKALIFGLLALTLVATLWPLPEQEVSHKPAPGSPEPKAEAARNTEALPNANTAADAVAAADGKAAIVNIFPAQSWAPKPAAPAKPPPPEPPPLPFVFAGRYVEEGKLMVFLMEGDAMYAVRQGDALPGGWKLTEIAQTSLIFFYAPLNLSRSMPMSELRP